MTDVFLSFSRVDFDKVSIIKQMLEALGLQVFLAGRDIPAGEDNLRELDRKLNGAGAVLAVWSEHSINSEWVKIESQKAIEQGKLAAVQINEISLLDKPAAFSDIPWMNLQEFDGNPNHPGWINTVLKLARILRRTDLIRKNKKLIADVKLANKLAAASERETPVGDWQRLKPNSFLSAFHRKMRFLNISIIGALFIAGGVLVLSTVGLSALSSFQKSNQAENRPALAIAFNLAQENREIVAVSDAAGTVIIYENGIKKGRINGHGSMVVETRLIDEGQSIITIDENGNGRKTSIAGLGIRSWPDLKQPLNDVMQELWEPFGLPAADTARSLTRRFPNLSVLGFALLLSGLFLILLSSYSILGERFRNFVKRN